MSNKVPRLFLPTLFAALASLLALPLCAGNPLLVDTSGRFITWQSFPIQTVFDQGMLGNLSNADAKSLAQQIFNRWQNVSTARLTFQDAGQISRDITNKSELDSFRSCNAGSELLGKFAVIYDTDGTITDETFGSGQKDMVLGFASPRCIAQVSQTGPLSISASTAILNGFALTKPNPVSQDDYRAVALHEVGHALGLDHTQLNANLRFSSNFADRAAVPLMYPFLTRNRPDPLGLALDDTTEISALYPGASFPTEPSITGTVLLADGQTPFQGANVVARNANDPNVTAAANVSGTRFTRSQQGFGSSDPQFKGKYEFFGLPAGSYNLSVESIESRFTEGSSVGPLDPPFPLPFGPVNAGSVTVASGSTTTQNIQLAPAAALPSMTFLNIIPHFAIGGGYVTRVFLKNLSSSTNNVVIQFIGQNGAVINSEARQIPAGQTIQLSSGEASRSLSQTTQWLAIGSDQLVSASVLFDCCAAGTNVTTAVGVLATPPAITFTAPFLYQREGQASVPLLVLGLGIANRSDQSNTITIRLLDENGAQVASDTLTALPGFGQTALAVPDFTQTKVPTINSFLTGKDTFLGSIVISGTQQFAPVIVGNLGTRLFSLPLIAQ